ncbi:MAG: hypothetical protein E7262_10365 [Lachnospiraceae bacterium]|nr:hypothetical protein [Lachnospiraceae bacterium]
MKRSFLKKVGVLITGAALVGVLVSGGKITSNACTPKLGIKLGFFNSRIKVEQPSYEYTGEAIEAEVIVTYKNIELEEGKDYTTSYKNNVEPGVAKVTIKGIGNYRGSKSTKFLIEEKDEVQDDVIEDNQEEVLTKNIDFSDSQFFAIAETGRFLVDTMASDYLVNPDSLSYVDAGMGTAFMLFPKNKDVKFTIESVMIGETLTPVETLAKDVTGPIVIWSHEVEYAPSIQVVATYKDKTVTMPICFNGIDGKLAITDPEYIVDITP